MPIGLSEALRHPATRYLIERWMIEALRAAHQFGEREMTEDEVVRMVELSLFSEPETARATIGQ